MKIHFSYEEEEGPQARQYAADIVRHMGRCRVKSPRKDGKGRRHIYITSAPVRSVSEQGGHETDGENMV